MLVAAGRFTARYLEVTTAYEEINLLLLLLLKLLHGLVNLVQLAMATALYSYLEQHH